MTYEEQVLVNGLKELVSTGWKSDNGFRTGCLGILELCYRKSSRGRILRPHHTSIP